MSWPDPPIRAPKLDLDSARRLALVAIHTQSAVVIGDGQGFVEWVNEAFERLTGCKSEEVIGKPIQEVLRPRDVDEVALGRLRAQLARGEAARLELRAERSGTPLRLELEVEPVRDAAGRVMHFLVLATDITARLAAERRDRRLREEALEAQRGESLQRLATGVARRFDPLLGSLAEHADLTLTELLSAAPAVKCLREIRREALRAARLVEQLRTLAGQRRLVGRSVDLSALVANCSQELDALSERGETLSFDLSAKLPPIRADGSQLRELLVSLVANALEALGDQSGTVRVRTGTREVGEDTWAEVRPKGSLSADSCVFLEVSDNGCGIDPALRARVLDPFFSTKNAGRGLGLATALGIVQAHRAGLLLQSEPGSGTTVTVLFPCSTKAVRHQRRQRTAARQSARPRRVVLLMEEDSSVRDRAQRALRRSGFRVIATGGGEQGLECFREHAWEVDAVLLAPLLTEPRGGETARRVRLIRPDVRFVIASLYRDEELDEELAEGEVARFLQKPYTSKELVGAVRSVLSG